MHCESSAPMCNGLTIARCSVRADRRKETAMSRIALLVVVLGSLTVQTFAQCTKDTDCRDPRICVKGACEDPSGAAKTKSDAKHAFVCFFAGAATGELVPGVEEASMTALLKQVGDSVLLTSLPAVVTGPVDTAAAKIEDAPQPRRIIMYNPRYMSDLKTSDGDFAVLFVLAHELGHHVNADVWLADRDERYKYEYAADAFAARVLARLNATKQQTLAAINKF